MDRGTRHQAPVRRPGLTVRALVCGLALLAGCVATRPHLDEALLATAPADALEVAAQYQVAAPDVLELQTAGREDLSGLRPIGVDGRIDLGPLGRVRIEGMTPLEVAQAVAREAELPAEMVSVRVAEHRSQQVYLFGAVTGMQRPVPYVGPETVLALLQRTGGITPGASVGNVYVIRPHVIDGGNPEVFHIDLEAILRRRDQVTNIRVQPFDQVYVGESKKCTFEKVVPPCLRPLYERAFGLRRDGP
jgi:protein involved in polysaccharide export with SLBB domain